MKKSATVRSQINAVNGQVYKFKWRIARDYFETFRAVASVVVYIESLRVSGFLLEIEAMRAVEDVFIKTIANIRVLRGDVRDRHF